MLITNDASHATNAATGAPPAGTPPSSTNPVDGMANEQTFLQLLVAQIQNQDPLSPTDSMQFVSQLAQFSSLEQLIGIHQSVDTLSSTLAASTNTNTNTTGTNGTTPSPGK